MRTEDLKVNHRDSTETVPLKLFAKNNQVKCALIWGNMCRFQWSSECGALCTTRTRYKCMRHCCVHGNKLHKHRKLHNNILLLKSKSVAVDLRRTANKWRKKKDERRSSSTSIVDFMVWLLYVSLSIYIYIWNTNKPDTVVAYYVARIWNKQYVNYYYTADDSSMDARRQNGNNNECVPCQWNWKYRYRYRVHLIFLFFFSFVGHVDIRNDQNFRTRSEWNKIRKKCARKKTIRIQAGIGLKCPCECLCECFCFIYSIGRNRNAQKREKFSTQMPTIAMSIQVT